MKGNLLQGTARGRMGEIVASVRHGKQLFSKYQPNINNPKSPKQMNQRERFSRASKFAKTFVSDSIYSNTYATLKNSSRSLYVNIVQREILYELMGGGANLPTSRILPLMSNNINGNLFNNPLVNDSVAGNGTLLINGAKPTTNTIYFGSFTKFKGNEAIIKAITPNITGVEFRASLNVIKSDLTEASIDVINVSSPANHGFHNSVADCGNFPFVYSLKLDEESGFGMMFENPSVLEESKPIGDVLIFSNENETIAYLHNREVETLEVEPAWSIR